MLSSVGRTFPSAQSAKRAGLLLLVLLPASGPSSRAQTIPLAPGADFIRVVYPRDSQAIGPVDSTFILGSVPPGSRLRINGQKVDVYRTGGFLAWLPVQPGPFRFRLRAETGAGVDTASVYVTIADPRPIPPDSGVMIRENSVRPQWPRTIRAGDEIAVGFDGTIGGKASFRIITPADTLGPFPMTELRAETYFDFGAYRRDQLFENDSPPMQAERVPSRGRYQGIWQVPEGLPAEFLRVLVELSGTVPGATAPVKYPDSLYGPPPPARPREGQAVAVAPGRLLPVDDRAPRVVELTDSIQILRLGPRLGYLTIHQPFGVRARWWGEAGPWTILQPLPGYEAWIETEKTRLLPEGTPLPGSDIARIWTRATPQSVGLSIGTSERLPFKVVVEEDLQTVRVLLFGATTNTDWVEQDPADDLIESVTWTQTQPRLYEVTVRLRKPLWGYDARYEGTRFLLEFIRPPVITNGLEGLTIAVDPGHSPDPGAVGPTGFMEKDANLLMSKKVREELRDAGARVVMTRQDTEGVALYERPAIAVSNQANLYVSLHYNAVPDGINPLTRNGTGTYYYHPFSRDLARHVHTRLLEGTGLPDYGLTQGNFAVIRPTQYPSVLLECAFIILPEQEEMIKTEEFIDRTAKGIVRGIREFLESRLSSR